MAMLPRFWRTRPPTSALSSDRKTVAQSGQPLRRQWPRLEDRGRNNSPGLRWRCCRVSGGRDRQLRHCLPIGRQWLSLVNRYDGNGLALKIVGETIRQVYDGDVAAFLADATANFGTVFGGIRRLLDAQAERLSPLERDVLTRLAVEREPIGLVALSTALARNIARSTVVESIETLRRRSLVE